MYPSIALWESILFLVGGFVALSWSSDRLIEDAAFVARSFGISTFAIGIVLVGFGTSLPEFAVSVLASADGHADLAVANVFGSNTYNIAVILSLAALIHPIRLPAKIRWRAIPILICVTALSWFLVFSQGGISRLWGCAMIAMFLFVLPLMMQTDAPLRVSLALDQEDDSRHHGVVVRILVFLVTIFAASHFIVWGAVAVARAAGVSETAIGLSVVALGTSLPELATTLAAMHHRDTSLALGNILGSNFFNTLAVIGTAAAVHPLAPLSDAIIFRDIPICLLTSAFLITKKLTRHRAILLLTLYLLYILFVF